MLDGPSKFSKDPLILTWRRLRVFRSDQGSLDFKVSESCPNISSESVLFISSGVKKEG